MKAFYQSTCPYIVASFFSLVTTHSTDSTKTILVMPVPLFVIPIETIYDHTYRLPRKLAINDKNYFGFSK